jgi:hypothetical protein
MSKKKVKNIAVGVLVLMFLAGSLCLTVWQQNAQKSELIVQFLSGTEPVKPVSFNVKNKNLSFGTNFAESDDWLKVFSVDIQNASGKSVTYVDLGVFVLRPKGDVSPPFHFSITKGNKKSALEQKDTGLLFASSKSSNHLLTVQLSEGEYLSIRDSLDRLGYPSKIERLELQVEEVGFSDGTFWSLGKWFRADPEKPENLIPIVDYKGDDRKIVAFSDFTEDVCVSPIYADRECSRSGGTVCTAKTVGQTDNTAQTHRVTQGYERCYVTSRDGTRGDYCGSDILVNLPRTCPTPTPTPTPNLPGGCNGMANYSVYPGTGCAPGFINSGGMCTRSAGLLALAIDLAAITQSHAVVTALAIRARADARRSWWIFSVTDSR